jgi:hypothetical protein
MKVNVTLFILKSDKELYAFSTDKKIVSDFISTRCMNNFIIKEKKLNEEEYDTFGNINNDKILNNDYLYDGKNTIEFPMTTNESYTLDITIDELYERIGDNKSIIDLYKVFRGKYKKSLKYIIEYISSFYYNNDVEFASLNVFIKLFGFTMIESERYEQ